MPSSARPMWTCPECGRQFANRGQVHTCREPSEIEIHFDRSEPHVRATFDEFVAVARQSGPFEIIPQATRIALHARMSFAALKPRRRWLSGHVVLAERLDSDRFRVTSYSPRNHVHEFRLDRPEDIDTEMREAIAAAYQVGVQRHHDEPER